MGILKQLEAKSLRCRKAVHDDGEHARNIGVDLLHGHAGLEPGERLVAEVAEMDLAAVKVKSIDQRGIGHVEKMKFLRQHTNDLVSFAVEY